MKTHADARAVEKAAGGGVCRPHDPEEHEDDRAAAVVARGGSDYGWSFSALRLSAPAEQREEDRKANDEEEQ